MATENTANPDRPPMTVAELVTYTKRELDEDAERLAKLPADVPKESQTGVTLDLSHKGIRALPVEVIGLIKDRVERHGSYERRSP